MRRAAWSEQRTVRGDAALQLDRAILRAGANIAATLSDKSQSQLQGDCVWHFCNSLKVIDKSLQF